MQIVAEASFISGRNERPNGLNNLQHPSGRPLNVVCKIKVSFHWGENHIANSIMEYEIEEDRNDWIVAGQRRGTFIAEVCSLHVMALSVIHNFQKDAQVIRIPLTLTPIRHGELLLPRIRVFPSKHSESLIPPSSVCLQKDAASRILVLPRNSRSTFILDVETQSSELSE